MNIQRGRQEDLGLKAEDGWMDGCTERVGRKWGQKALKPGGSPGSNSWSRVGHPLLKWNLGGGSSLGSTGGSSTSRSPHTWCLSIYKL